MGAKDNNGSKIWNLYIQSSKEVIADAWNTLLNVFNNTLGRLYKETNVLKKGNSKIKKELTDLRERV